jgi:hypothetical protein
MEKVNIENEKLEAELWGIIFDKRQEKVVDKK